MLLYAHTAQCFTSSAQQMESHFAPCLRYSPIQGICCFFFFYFSLPVSEGKEGCGNGTFENWLFLPVLQSPRRMDLPGLEGSRGKRDGICLSAVLKEQRLSRHYQHKK